jgi:Capsule polysaccharide biosynthesis protein
LLGPETMNFSPRSVFFPLHYQPEQTTLVGGIYFANQVGVLENIAKALPFGYSLIVKEHPRGRGARPAWQYTHLAHFPNIEFCDADTKDILRRCEAAVTIAGTIGLEALAMDKPVILLGQCQYDFVDVVYRAESWPDLARIFRRILIDRDYERNSARHRVIDRFFLAFLATQVPVPRNKESADTIAAAICEELGVHECKIAAAPATATAPELAQ